MPQIKHYKKEAPRLNIFYLIFGVLFSILVVGLGWRQIVQYDSFIKQEKQQSLRRILQPGTRGNIVDRSGALLVGNRPVFSAVIYLNELRPAFRAEYHRQVKQAKSRGQKVDRAHIRQKSRQWVVERYLTQLNILLGRRIRVDDKELERHFAQRLLLPFPLIRDLTLEEYALLTERLPVTSAVQIYTDSTRYYPHGALAAHVLGYVGSTLDIPETQGAFTHLKTFSLRGKEGRSGLEKAFDEHLQGKSGAEIWLVDPAGFQCERIEKIPSTQGPALHTSLDLRTQIAADHALEGLTGAIVAIAVDTGEVLALASHPSYDLNTLVPYISHEVYDEINSQGAWLNRATQGLYPPGSPFKVITALAGLRAGLLPETRQTDCVGTVRVGTRLFPCMKRSGHGVVHLDEAIAYSCNPFFYQLALDVGPEALAAEACRYGLDKPTGLELPYETRRMIVPTPIWKKENRGANWFGGDTANTAIGQGFLLTTPLQMACFAASLARGECTTVPTLLHDANRPKQRTEPIGISKEDYARLIHAMELTTQIGTGKRMQIPGIRIASKTGTAQINVKKDIDLAWSIAFAPVDNPKIAVCVLVEEVDKADRFQGGTTACPPAKAVLEAYLNAGE